MNVYSEGPPGVTQRGEVPRKRTFKRERLPSFCTQTGGGGAVPGGGKEPPWGMRFGAGLRKWFGEERAGPVPARRLGAILGVPKRGRER